MVRLRTLGATAVGAWLLSVAAHAAQLFECSLESVRGTYLVTYQELSGDCATMEPRLIPYDPTPKTSDRDGCEMVSWYRADECVGYIRSRCANEEMIGEDLESVRLISQEGSGFEATFERTLYWQGRPYCHAIYRSHWVRQ